MAMVATMGRTMERILGTMMVGSLSIVIITIITITIILVITKVIKNHIPATKAITVILTFIIKVIMGTTVTLGTGHQHHLSAMASGFLKSLIQLDSNNSI